MYGDKFSLLGLEGYVENCIMENICFVPEGTQKWCTIDV